MRQIEKLFIDYFGEEITTIRQFPSSGSNRNYFRIYGVNYTAIGVEWHNVEENNAFCHLSKHFVSRGLSMPKVYSISEDRCSYIQEDVGNEILYDIVEHGRISGQYSSEEVSLLKKTIAALPKIQFEGAIGLDFSVCYPQPSFDKRMIEFDLNYFKYNFLKLTGLEFNEMRLQDDFDALSNHLLRYDSNTFMYRDFQARNVMLKDGEPYFIDFQGGRRGPIYYDVASFVWQAKANYPKKLKNELIDTYIESLKPYSDITRNEFDAIFRHFVLFRTLQVLGAYGFRGLFEKKAHFLQSIPFALANLKEILDTPFEEYPYLSELLLKVADMDRFSTGDIDSHDGKLIVEIYSFSYKRGFPDDFSGNGGGYVFDCRSIHNPGKYEQYRYLTGNDQPVIDFLEKDGEILDFLEDVYKLADRHVKRYIERGFTHLMFCFGCTGGQHRSVYCANHLAEYLSSRYDIVVKLTHRELK